jgi:galactonate dehydratase
MMIIIKLEIWRRQLPQKSKLLKMTGNWIFPKIFTDDGQTGIGEASYSGNDANCCERIQYYFESYLKECKLNQLFLENVKSQIFPEVRTLVEQTAISSLIMACEELLAKFQSESVGEFLGTKSNCSTVQMYATINRALAGRSPEAFESAAISAYNEGYEFIKCAPFDEVLPMMSAGDKQRSIRKGIERLTAIRESLPEDVNLMVDCHGRFDLESTSWLGKILDPYRLFWVEEPLPESEDIGTMMKVRENIPQKIAAGETLFGVQGFAPLIESGAVDVIMPDVKHVGGFQELLKVGKYAGRFGIEVAPHNMSGPISNAASVQCAVLLKNCEMVEYPWGEIEDRRSDPVEVIENGKYIPPGGSGWGVKMKI